MNQNQNRRGTATHDDTYAQALDKAREDLRNASEEEYKGVAQLVAIGEAKLAAIDSPAYD